MPKQYLPLLGLPIALHRFLSFIKVSNSSSQQGDVWTQESLHFVHSLKTFCQLKEVKEVVVVCDSDYSDVFEGSNISHSSIFIDLAMFLSKVY